ncbi:MAG TPA: multicopper oxidase family protein [Candidatus Baltobacteraceae bacterium]
MLVSRRQLLVGGAATAATLVVLSADGCNLSNLSGGGGLPGGLDSYTLVPQYATHTYAGKTLRTRTYGGMIPGPTIYAAPGQPLNVTINNQLPLNPAAPIPQSVVVHPSDTMDEMGGRMAPQGVGVLSTSIDLMNNPHLFNTTNLHVHGLQVVPHLFEPVGTSDPSAMMVAVEPGGQFTYNFTVPIDQPSGLYWYHPHHHGSTDVQVSGGMAGLLLVGGPIDRVPEIAAARDLQYAIQTLQVNQDTTNPNLYSTEYIAYQTANNGGYNPRSEYLFMLVNGQLVSEMDFTTVPIGTSTNFAPPQVQMQPGEVVRLRLLNGSNELLFPLQLPGFDVYVIGIDGVNFLAPQHVVQDGVNTVQMAAGNRVELLLRAPATPGNYTLFSKAITAHGLHPWPQFNFLQFVVAGAPLAMAIPTTLPTPTREYPLIADGEIVGNRNVVFDSEPSTSILSGTALLINGVVYDEMAIVFDLKLGTAEQWTVSNKMAEGHPFHLHTNSFEVHSVTDPSGTITYSPPYLADTVWIPGNGTAILRARYKQWQGKDVFHCHKLSHEDQGMMANTLLS